VHLESTFLWSLPCTTDQTETRQPRRFRALPESDLRKPCESSPLYPFASKAFFNFERAGEEILWMACLLTPMVCPISDKLRPRRMCSITICSRGERLFKRSL